MDKNSLDGLFMAAKNAAPEITFEETQTAFVQSIAAAGSASVWMKIVNTFKNPFIMISTTGIIIATLALTVINTSEPEVMDASHSLAEPKTEQISPAAAAPSQKDVSVQVAVARVEQDDSTISFLENRVGETPLKTAIYPQNSTENSTGSTESMKATGYNSGVEKEETLEYVYNISHATPESEFQAMQAQAIMAGIDFTFKMKKDKLRKLKMEVKKGSSSQFTSLLFSGDFESTIGWVTDENGAFERFYESEESLYYEALDNAIDDIEDIFEDLGDQLENSISDEVKLTNAHHDLNVLRGGAISNIMEIDPSSVENPIELLNTLVTYSDTITAEQVAAIETEFKLQEVEGLEMVTTDITESTTEAELVAIQEKAIKAGITMSMDYKYKKGVLTKLDIGMRLKSSGKNQFSSFLIKSGKKSLWNSQLVWRVDETGQAVDFDGNRCQMIKVN